MFQVLSFREIFLSSFPSKSHSLFQIFHLHLSPGFLNRQTGGSSPACRGASGPTGALPKDPVGFRAPFPVSRIL